MNDSQIIMLAAAAGALAIIVAAIYHFVQLSKEQKIENIKEWLKWAVTMAEKELGAGTGQLKLRQVYNMAVKEFPWIVKLVSFELFSQWVDEALVWMEAQLVSNKAIQQLVS